MPAENRHTMKYGYETLTCRSAVPSFFRRQRTNNEIADNGTDSRSLNICAATSRNNVIGSQRRNVVAETPTLRVAAAAEE